MKCAIGGDHEVQGDRVSSLIMPMGFMNGYQCWMKLQFCGGHADVKLGDFPPGTDFYGQLQIGESEEDVRSMDLLM